ncbi:MAG: hypothetical protein B6U75_01020 [Desulfurococcales archaeon ex4484_217_1]|nr:MAG: hypothetical protein B6U75_01020 [Desulfurococcales archaeon ex4484_217_1]
MSNMLLLLMLLSYIIFIIPFILQLIYFVTSIKKNSKPHGGKFIHATFPQVSILVPVRNEDPQLIVKLLRSISRLHYDKSKLEVIIISDDRREDFLKLNSAVQQKLERLNYEVKLLWRSKPIGYKAGALNYGLKYAKGDIIAVFDADSEPEPNILTVVLNYMRDGYDAVMIKWVPSNAHESLLSEAVGLYQEFAFKTLFAGRFKALGYTSLAGSGFFINRKVLDDVGGFCEETILEDVDLGLRLFLKGYRICYTEDTYVRLEVPSNYVSYKEQQKRWAYGALQILRKYFGAILKCRRALIEKIEYITYLAQYLSSFFLMFFSLMLVLYLRYADMVLVVLYLFAAWLTVSVVYSMFFMSFGASKGLSAFRALRILGRISGITYPMIPHLISAMLKAALGKRFFWFVTPKGQKKQNMRRKISLFYETLFYLALAMLTLYVIIEGYIIASLWLLLQLSSAPYFYYMFLRGKV